MSVIDGFALVLDDDELAAFESKNSRSSGLIALTTYSPESKWRHWPLQFQTT
jgi:hypothetical protein